MDLPPSKNLLENLNFRPSKGLGQNFLINKGVIKKIIDAAQLSQNDIVLEIGPGLGVLTKKLAEKSKTVIAVEKDKRMCEALEKSLESWNIKNVKAINDDILKFSHTDYKIQDTRYKIVANLPFYLTAPTIRKFLESENQPSEMVLIIQKEVAQRICAKPPKMSILAVSVQFYATPKIISYIPKESFWPKPKVDSAIIKLTTLNLQHTTNRNLFFKIVKAGFLQPRKQLANNLSDGLKIDKNKISVWLAKNNIEPTQRAETLSVENWITIAKTSIIS